MRNTTCYFVATQAFKNARNNWESIMQNDYDGVQNEFNCKASKNLQGGVKDDTIYFASVTRDAVEDEWLGGVKAKVNSRAALDDAASVVVYDKHDYSFQGIAQTPTESHDPNDDPRVAVVGDSPVSGREKVALHETVHTFGVPHGHHREYTPWECSIMGPDSDGCGGNNFFTLGPDDLSKNINDSTSCWKRSSSKTVLNSFISSI